MRCFICDEPIERAGIMVSGDYMFRICRQRAEAIGEVYKVAVTRKEIRISDASLSYLQSDEVAEAFCGQCPWNIYEPYRKNLITGELTPPHQECPADFSIGSDRCAMKAQFEEVVETLAEADKLAGLKREVKIIL
jgi:hypothetical protein